MSKTALFRIGPEFQHRMRFGEVIELYRACYFRGKQLGYEDGYIYFEWPQKIAYNGNYSNKDYFKCPTHSILPIKFIDNLSTNSIKFDKIYDLCQPNIFYDGNKPFYESTIQKKNYESHLGYLNKYFMDTGERPIFNIPKDKIDKPYILFHVRIATWSTQRNPDLNKYIEVVNMFKEIYKDKYEFVKCGEPCRGMNRLFDKIIPYYEELDDVIKLFNNSSLVVCADSGPNAIAWGLGIPIFIIDCPHFSRGEIVNYHHPNFWKQFGGEIGETPYDWMDRNKIKVFYKGNVINKEDIISYTGKWL